MARSRAVTCVKFGDVASVTIKQTADNIISHAVYGGAAA